MIRAALAHTIEASMSRVPSRFVMSVGTRRIAAWGAVALVLVAGVLAYASPAFERDVAFLLSLCS